MTNNWNLLGHDWAVDLLKAQAANSKVRQAYLFIGPQGVGRRTLALRLAQALNCTAPPKPGEVCGECRACRGFAAMQHADLLILERQQGDREIKVSALREITRSLSRTPLEAKVQVALFLNFHEATKEAANALLKTLEEPNPSVLICITAPDADSLPETIASRCEIIRLRPVAINLLSEGLQKKLSIDPARAKLLASLSNGLPGKAIQMQSDADILKKRAKWLDAGEELLKLDRVRRFAYAEKASKDREEVRGLLLAWLSFWNDVLLRTGQSKQDPANPDREGSIASLASRLTFDHVFRVVSTLERTLELLVTNVNVRLVMETVLLELPDL